MYFKIKLLTFRHSGQVRAVLSSFCPHWCCPWTWPHCRYTYGCRSDSPRVPFLGSTRVFSPTGHWGRPALMVSTRFSNSCSLCNRANKLHSYNSNQNEILTWKWNTHTGNNTTVDVYKWNFPRTVLVIIFSDWQLMVTFFNLPVKKSVLKQTSIAK